MKRGNLFFPKQLYFSDQMYVGRYDSVGQQNFFYGLRRCVKQQSTLRFRYVVNGYRCYRGIHSKPMTRKVNQTERVCGVCMRF